MDSTLLGLSVLGFGAFLVVDSPLLSRYAPLRYATSLIGSGALTLAFVRALPSGAPLPWPAWFKPFGWLVAAAGGGLSVYSVFIEIPLTLARGAPGAEAKPALVQTGTYALCRHPGVLWLILMLGGAVLIVRRTGLFRLAFVWITLDIGLVAVQDRVIFPRLFPAYRHYQQTTPFLAPNRCGLINCLQGRPNGVVSSENQ